MVKRSQVHEVGEGRLRGMRPSCPEPSNWAFRNQAVRVCGAEFSIKSSGPGGASSCPGCLGSPQPWARGKEREALGPGVAALHPGSQGAQLPLAAGAGALGGCAFPA